jgi:hypothetical protein
VVYLNVIFAQLAKKYPAPVKEKEKTVFITTPEKTPH